MGEVEDLYQRFLTPAEEIDRRLGEARGLLSRAGLDGLLVFHPVNLLYFSGTRQNAVLWIPARGEPTLWIRRSLDRARRETPLARVLPWRGPEGFEAFCAAADLRAVGLELDVLPAVEFLKLRERLPETRLENAAALVRGLRQVKSPWEIEWMRRAASLHDEVFGEIPRMIRESEDELGLAARIEYALRLRGHQGPTPLHRWNQSLFYGPVVTGPSACYPCGFDGPVGGRGLYPAVPEGAGWRRLRDGEPILVDVVFGYNGYLVDRTRTFVPRRPLSPGLQKAYDVCLEIQDEIVRGLAPGRPCSDLYREVMERFEKSTPPPGRPMGLGENRVRFLGHGVGLELDEWPVLAPGCDEPLQAGMTLAVEPKIFFPGQGGVGIENTFLLTEQGPERLGNHPDELVLVA